MPYKFFLLVCLWLAGQSCGRWNHDLEASKSSNIVTYLLNIVTRLMALEIQIRLTSRRNKRFVLWNLIYIMNMRFVFCTHFVGEKKLSVIYFFFDIYLRFGSYCYHPTNFINSKYIITFGHLYLNSILFPINWVFTTSNWFSNKN